MSQVTPRAVANIGWKTLLMFAIFNFANIIYVWVVIKETNGKSLEEMEAVFGTVQRTTSTDAGTLDHETRGYFDTAEVPVDSIDRK